MLGKNHSKTNIKNLQLKIDDFSNLIYSTFRMKNKSIFNNSNNNETPPVNTTASNSNLVYPIISSNNTKVTRIKSITQQNFYQPEKHKKIISTDYNSNNDNNNNNTKQKPVLKSSKKILLTLQKTMKKIKDKKREERLKELFNDTFIIKTKIKKNFIKTLPKFDTKENKLLLQENNKNKNKFKELRFKIHNTIKMNTLPLCNSYMNKSHLFNEKLLEYYRSENHINLLKNFKKDFKFNINIQNHPKVKMYTDIGELEKISESNKVDFKKVFTPEEQKLILLDTAYYFQRDSPNIFTNVNISKKKNLSDRIQDEDEENQIKKILNDLLNKKNKKKLKKFKMGIYTGEELRNLGDDAINKINKIISSKEMKNINSKKLEELDLNDFTPSKNGAENEISKNMRDNKKYNFFKIYKINIKESDKRAEKLRISDIDKFNKKNQFCFNVESKLKSCTREINMISKDKALQKRAKERLYYDKSKDEQNEFNIFTKQMLIEQNYEYISKHKRKLRDVNKKNLFDNKKDELAENINESSKKKNNNILSENKDKKFINYYINKIKLNYKNQ